jgi:hypothetical protein
MAEPLVFVNDARRRLNIHLCPGFCHRICLCRGQERIKGALASISPHSFFCSGHVLGCERNVDTRASADLCCKSRSIRDPESFAKEMGSESKCGQQLSSSFVKGLLKRARIPLQRAISPSNEGRLSTSLISEHCLDVDDFVAAWAFLDKRFHLFQRATHKGFSANSSRQQDSAELKRCLDLVRDQEVDGSNPFAPTIFCN